MEKLLYFWVDKSHKRATNSTGICANWINCLLYILKVLLNLHNFPLLNINCTEPYLGPLYRSYIIVQISNCKIPERGLLNGAICKRFSKVSRRWKCAACHSCVTSCKFTLTTLSKFWFEISLNSCSPMGQPISCRRLLSVLSDTNRNFAIFRHVNVTLLRLQICISVILCTGLPGIPFRIVSQASPCTNSVFRPSSRNSCLAWKWKTWLSTRPINSCTSELKLLHCFAVQATTHTLSVSLQSPPLFLQTIHTYWCCQLNDGVPFHTAKMGEWK